MFSLQRLGTYLIVFSSLIIFSGSGFANSDVAGGRGGGDDDDDDDADDDDDDDATASLTIFIAFLNSSQPSWILSNAFADWSNARIIILVNSGSMVNLNSLSRF